ncbi:MAG TPA: spore germination protein GerW family protein [Actinomycetota bacterium]
MTTTQEVHEAMESAKDVMSVRRVFGEPVEKDGITVIPAARVQGGAGGGTGEAPDGKGQGSGSGFGLNAKPAGVYVIAGDDVTWRPAVDPNKVIVGAAFVAVAALLLARSVVKARAAVLTAHR